MKKKLVLLTAAIALLIIATAILCACDPNEEKLTGIDLVRYQYSEIASAKTIKQTIEIKSGEITQFESDKTYTATAEGYTVTGSEKKLNGLDASEPFTETPIAETLQKAAGATPTLNLDAKYFEQGYRLTDTELTANVKPENIKNVFAVSNDFVAPTDNLILHMNISGGHVVAVTISYTANESNVTISLTMTY